MICRRCDDTGWTMAAWAAGWRIDARTIPSTAVKQRCTCPIGQAPPCEKCHDYQWIYVGDAVTRCACWHFRQIRYHVADARIPDHLLASTLERFETQTAAHRRALAAARACVAGTAPQPGLFLYGKHGTGKTTLAVALLKALLRESSARSGVFWVLRDLFEAIRERYTQRTGAGAVLGPVLSRDVLVLDAFALVKGTEWEASMLDEIIGTRYNENRVTILTARERPDDPRFFRIRSQLAEMCVWVQL